MERKADLKAIEPTLFQHPFDIKAIQALRALKGFDFVCHKMMEYGYEKVQYINLIGNHVKITPRQCPRIYEIFAETVSSLAVDEPALFIGQEGEMNAYTSGAEKPFIVIDASLVEQLSDDELQIVLAHELGHIKCRHVIYNMVSDFVRDFAGVLSSATLGLGSVLSSGFELALFNWHRKAELSCDRAALLATGNLDACIRTFMIISGGAKDISDQMNPEEFVKQADLYSELDSSILNKVYKFLLVKYQSHPFGVLRAKELTEWSRSEQYQNLLCGNYGWTAQPDTKTAETDGIDVQALKAGLEESAKEAVKNISSGFKGFIKRKIE